MGAVVTGLALPPATLPSAYALLDIRNRVESRFGDVRDDRALDDALRAAEPEIVFHLAAQATVRRAYAEPAATFDVNVMGTVRVLEAIRRSSSVRAVVVVTSDKCYADDGEPRERGYVEADPLGGSEPYAASKACAEIVTAAYRQALFFDRGVRAASVRAGNVIGGGDWTSERLVTDLVAALQAGRALNLRFPAATRPWQHVLEPLCGYLLLAERLALGLDAYARAWNFGPAPTDVTTVEAFVALFEREWGACAPRDGGLGAHPHESLHLLLDSTRAHDALDWHSRLPLARAIEWTVDWYKSAGTTAEAIAITERQIDAYRELSPADSHPARAGAMLPA